MGATFLSDNAPRPVERAAETRQPIQMSNFRRIEFIELNSTHCRNGTYELRLTLQEEDRRRSHLSG